MIKSAQQLIQEAQQHINCIDVESAHQLYQSKSNVFIVDLREPENAAHSKLNDAVNIPRGLLEMKIQKFCTDPHQLILLHCAAGGRASLAALTLQQMGYRNVYAITASFDEIKQQFDGDSA